MSRGPSDKATVEPLRPPRPCPICDKQSVRDNYPFCSQRCAGVDLSRWLKGSYAIPAVEEEIPDDEDSGGHY